MEMLNSFSPDLEPALIALSNNPFFKDVVFLCLVGQQNGSDLNPVENLVCIQEENEFNRSNNTDQMEVAIKATWAFLIAQ